MEVTSQTNKEKRDLVLVGGVNGSNKAFTVFDVCSLVEQSGLSDMIELLGESIKEVSLVATDGDSNEYDIIDEAVLRKEYWNCTRILCWYHLWAQKWLKQIINKCDISCPNSICQNIYDWVSSWNLGVESNDEFVYSFDNLQKFIMENKTELGDAFVNSIVTYIDKSMMPHKRNWEFTYRYKVFGGYHTTTSSLEACNSALKTTSVATVRPNLNIDKSICNQMLQIENRNRNRSR